MIQGSDDIREAYRDDQVARSYIDRRFREPLGALLHDRQVALVTQIIQEHRPGRVLEVAPGPARLSCELAPAMRDGRLVLLDASAQMLSEARKRMRDVGRDGAAFVQADAFNLPFGAVFDLVYTFRLIRHFEEQDRARLYAQMARLLRPGGLLVFDAVNEVVSAPLRARAAPGEYQHYDALLRPPAIRAELAAAGFSVVHLHGLQHRYGLLTQLQVLIAPRSRALARAAMDVVESLGGGEPLEWVVVCRRA